MPTRVAAILRSHWGKSSSLRNPGACCSVKVQPLVALRARRLDGDTLHTPSRDDYIRLAVAGVGGSRWDSGVGSLSLASFVGSNQR